MTKEELEKLVEDTAKKCCKIWGCPFTVISCEECDMWEEHIDEAHSILFQPGLLVEVEETELPQVTFEARNDRKYKAGFLASQVEMVKAGYKKIIPLSEALKGIGK